MATISDHYGKAAFQGSLWTCVAVSFLFVLFRLAVRLKVFRTLFVDDALVVLGWLLLLVRVSVYTYYTDDVYVVFDAATGQSAAAIAESFGGYLRAQAITLITGPFCLYFVKASFLVFFYQLGKGVRKYERTWKVVTVYVVATFLVWLGVIPWKCMFGNAASIAKKCNTPNSTINAVQAALIIQTCMDVSSDIAILYIPLNLLWRVRMQMRQKLALTGLFSLTILTMVVSMARVVLVRVVTGMPLQFWLYVLTTVEMAVTVIVACLIVFRALFSDQADRSNPESRIGLQLESIRNKLSSIRRTTSSLARSSITARSVNDMYAPSDTGNHVAATEETSNPKGTTWTAREASHDSDSDQAPV